LPRQLWSWDGPSKLSQMEGESCESLYILHALGVRLSLGRRCAMGEAAEGHFSRGAQLRTVSLQRS
jgi:hypothetical protein